MNSRGHSGKNRTQSPNHRNHGKSESR
jgi:hypothetical protein